MPKHKPIKFEDAGISDELLMFLKNFKARHPITYSATKIILATAAFGGALTLAAVAPGLFYAFGKMRTQNFRERRDRYDRLWQAFNRLKKERAVELVREKNDELIYRLTDKGRIKLKSFALETLEIIKPEKWDGRWRVIIFDIPEKSRRIRRIFQRKLLEIGFYQLQKSVWVHPFPCEAEVEFLKDFFGVKSCVDILIVPQMPNGKVIYHFRNLLKDLL